MRNVSLYIPITACSCISFILKHRGFLIHYHICHYSKFYTTVINDHALLRFHFTCGIVQVLVCKAK